MHVFVTQRVGDGFKIAGSLEDGAALRKGDGLEDRGRPPGLRAGLKDWGSFEDGEGGLKDGGWPQGQGVASRTWGL